ncbi:polysaccharide deacetylase [Thermoanaerobacterium thermosaccharolyticum DSM 571]|uniref:Polysaccharide deacetylase n=1 Tax=Thermoanaerobacterium thermosaccharolyticum (strain ATCC 7956 / DSM 571 / NCIMB 9385 / NCA 3814 / NCTC 13789 / WDCM 00135 / 2032) TaxID=580327 RepID=D9TLV7_THETC|nr:polysaccharide deacetylase [Thermoanaerobacterium thermosaccharolyticum DSM 571]
MPNSKNLVKNNISRDTSIISNNNILLLLNRSNRNELFNSPIPINSNIFSINKKAGKIVALTFDDGPSKEFTKKYVDVLKSLNVKATFFVVGKMAEKNPALLKYIADNGNEIGLHSYSHQYMPKMSPQQIIDELYKTQAIIVNATGIKPDLFRPPYGAFNNTLLKIANALGLHVVLWTVDPDDWKNPGISNIINTTVSKTSHGSVILMHEGKAETLAALPQIVERLKSKGYSFATIPELMNAGN